MNNNMNIEQINIFLNIVINTHIHIYIYIYIYCILIFVFSYIDKSLNYENREFTNLSICCLSIVANMKHSVIPFTASSSTNTQYVCISSTPVAAVNY